MKSFYEILGVARGASDKEIRAAYRKLARQFHPDVNPNDRTAEERFKEINAAYEVLSDPEKRKKYDRYGAQWEQADQIEEMRKRQGGTWSWSTGGAGEGFGDLGSIFESLFKRERSAQTPFRRRGRDVEVETEITLEEAFHGAVRTVAGRSGDSCSSCGGTGEVAGATCHVCGGTGHGGRSRRLEVKIPQGAKTGSRVRVAGEGESGSAGAPPGDLYLVVRVREHGRFERRGDNLHLEADVPLLDAVLGGEIELETMEGRVALRIPELTQNGRQFRLSGKGMPVMGSSKRGDLVVRVNVRLPSELDEDERRLYEELRATRAGAPAGR